MNNTDVVSNNNVNNVNTGDTYTHDMAIDQLRKYLNKQIDAYLEANDLGYVQGSDRWKKKRMKTIGGSEQATVEGKNSFSGIMPLLLGKLGLKPFDRSIKMQWGNLFEDLLCEFVSVDLHTEVKGTEAFLRGRFPTQSYSPDGIAVVDMFYDIHTRKFIRAAHDNVSAASRTTSRRTSQVGNINNDLNPSEHPVPTIVLFEFKCPYSRIPTGKIAEYYAPQIFAGMDTIRLTQAAIFTEGVFRRCSVGSLDETPRYDKQLTPKDPVYINKPHAYGFVLFKFNSVGFTGNSANMIRLVSDLHNLHMEFKYRGHTIYKNNTDKIIDLGTVSEQHMIMHMNLFNDKILTPVYSRLFYTGENAAENGPDDVHTTLQRMLAESVAADDVVYGVLPYKLMYINYMYEDKIDGYLDQWKSKIDEIIGIVNKCEANPADTWKIITEYVSTGHIVESSC